MNKVYFSSVPSYDADILCRSVREIMLYYGMDKKVTGDTKILLKPNMLSKSTPDKAVTTHPVVVEAVVNAVIQLGAKAENITIADSCLQIDSGCYFGVDDYTIGLLSGMGSANIDTSGITCQGCGDNAESVVLTVADGEVTVEFVTE